MNFNQEKLKLAMIKIQRLIDRDYRGSRQVLQIHDSILVECPRLQAEAVAKLLVDTMENIYPELGIRLKVDVKIGSNWGEV